MDKFSKLDFTHSAEFSWVQRKLLLEDIDSNKERFDICVVGGGITGAGIARDAAQRGLKVILLEKGDFAEGTSSRSSKLIHGGVRYLEHFEFGLVAESTSERALLWKLAPHLAYPIPFLFPAYNTSRVPLWKLNLGLWIYDLLALFRTPGLHRTFFKNRSLKEEPLLRPDGLCGSIFYWDGATDDALLTLVTALDSWHMGAKLLTQTKVTKIEWNQETPLSTSQFHKVTFENNLSNSVHSVEAKVVISAVGPWTDQFPSLKSFAFPKLLATTRGSHIVVPKNKLPCKHALVMIHPQDQRVLFTIPWGSHTIVGTTDIFDQQNPDSVAITSDEVTYLLASANYFFPTCHLSAADVVSTWSGLRPLVAPANGTSAGAISREHHMEWREPGFLMIAGGKLTTHRRMAKDCVDHILESTQKWKFPLNPNVLPKPCRTHRRPLPTLAYPKKQPTLNDTEYSIPITEDLVQICKTQMVLSLEDLFVRRTQIFYKCFDNGLSLLDVIKTPVCEAMGWNDAQWSEQVQAYNRYLEQNVYIPLNKLNTL